MEIAILVIGLLYSIVLHELAHGYVAEKLGDYTPRYAGRLTLNPLAHLDPIGSFLVPLLTYLAGGFLIGWAKPVPINPYNFEKPDRDMALVAIAGPLTNIVIALILASFYKVFYFNGILLEPILPLIRLNLLLAVFNLIPIPPLDGSRVFLRNLDPQTMIFLEQFGFIFIFLFIYIAFPFLNLIVNFLFNLLL
ncbi:MAG: site-2 protease family protein [Minisyncoccia bacterium]|jgi:Zn-dependent protease